MNYELEILIRARVTSYHEQYPQYGPGYWDDYKLCVITGDIGHADILAGTITIARYFPATFLGAAHCLVMKITPDFQSCCNTNAVNNVKFCN